MPSVCRATCALLLAGLATSPLACGGDSSAAPKADAGHVADAKAADATADAKGDAKVVTKSDAGEGGSASDAAGEAEAAAPEVADPMAPPLLTIDCDPMVPQMCGYPFPSNVWTIPDTTTATGMHLYFGPTTLPMNASNVRVGAAPFATRDGFAQGSTILTYLPNATATGLPSQTTIASSVTKTSATILMEADTGALVPHFSEIDQRTSDPTQQAFMIEPSVRLKDATRYIVAIRHVVDAHGKTLPANPVFAALRDNTPSTDLTVPPRRKLYADIMSKLTANGITTSDLQLAWDFTTASQANTTQWMTSMRDDALMKVGAAGPSYTIDSVDMNPDPYIYKRLHGTMTVPYYLKTPSSGTVTALDGGVTVPASLNLGPNGLPVQNGTAKFPFLVHIPNSLVTSQKKGPILINAHGLLGVEEEGEDSYLAEICNREGYVGIAVQLFGMDSDDIAFIGGLFSQDASLFEMAVESQHQGLLNELLAVRMMMGGLATDPATAPNGNPTIDPTQRFYRGDSQGGIFGGTFMSISTDVTRGMMGEPGGPYTLLLNRSVDFNDFFLIIGLAFNQQELTTQFILNLLDQLWFRTEPAGYVGYMRENTLVNTPSHDVIIEAAIGDGEVTPLGAEFIARTIGAKNLQAVNREVYGITDAPSGFSGSGIVEWNFGLPTAPMTDTPPDAGPDPHDELRYVPAEMDMVDQFFRTGLVNQTCPDGGPCRVACYDGGLSTCTTVP
jgi:hypothetical protein